jgi:hypothetical protein
MTEGASYGRRIARALPGPALSLLASHSLIAPLPTNALLQQCPTNQRPPRRCQPPPMPTPPAPTGASTPSGTPRLSSAVVKGPGPSSMASPAPDTFVVIPAGTGTTALFLARHAPRRCRVLAVPCVGSSDYLRLQMEELDLASGGGADKIPQGGQLWGPSPLQEQGRGGAHLGLPQGHGHPEMEATLPEILSPPPRYSVPFGSVSPALLQSWRHARAQGVLLDLVYGPVAWAALRAHRWRNRRSSGGRVGEAFVGKYVGEGGAGGSRDGAAAYADGAMPLPAVQPTWLYIHTGGHEGLPSQLRRYARAGLLRAGEEDEVLAEVRDIWRRQGHGEVEGEVKIKR